MLTCAFFLCDANRAEGYHELYVNGVKATDRVRVLGVARVFRVCSRTRI